MVDVQGEQSTNDDGNEDTDAERNSSESFQFVLHWFWVFGILLDKKGE